MRSSYCPGGRSRKRKMPSTVVVAAGSLAALLAAMTAAPATGFPSWSRTSPWMEANPAIPSGRRRSGPGSTVTEGTSCAREPPLPKKMGHSTAPIHARPRWRKGQLLGAQGAVLQVSRVLERSKLLGNHRGKGRTMRLRIPRGSPLHGRGRPCLHYPYLHRPTSQVATVVPSLCKRGRTEGLSKCFNREELPFCVRIQWKLKAELREFSNFREYFWRRNDGYRYHGKRAATGHTLH